MTKTLTFADVRKTILAQIEKKGANYTYVRNTAARSYDQGPSCVNWDIVDGDRRTPSCIVGFAFDAWGVLDLVEQAAPAAYALSDLSSRNSLHFTDAARAYLRRVQREQDYGVPWGEAEETAFDTISSDVAAGMYGSEEEQVDGF